MGDEANRPRRAADLWKAVAAIIALFCAVTLLQVHIDAQTRSEANQKQALLVTSGPLLKKLSLGYAPLLADIYWTRAVQYYGSHLTHPDLAILTPLLNIAVTLDPHLVVAYRFGGVFLSAWRSGTQPAIDLVKKGIKANPNEWRLDYDLGFLYYWRLKDYKSSAEAYLAGANVPGAPSTLLRLFAATMAKKGGSIETSEMIFAGLYRSTDDKNVKKFAMDHLKSLKAQDDEQHLDRIIDQYRELRHRFPASMNDLVTAKMLPSIPVDPQGYPYIIGPDAKAHLNPASPIAPPKQ